MFQDNQLTHTHALYHKQHRLRAIFTSVPAVDPHVPLTPDGEMTALDARTADLAATGVSGCVRICFQGRCTVLSNTPGGDTLTACIK